MGGRPDIVLEQFRDEDGEWVLNQVFLGEVKYTQSADYAAAGLRELLEYMAFVRRRNDGGEYVEAPGDVLGSVDVKGLLFVDDLGIEVPEPDAITLVQYPPSEPLDRVL